ncbi:hypothetical protein I545_3499 [Mycobacterium kansasii 662]|uniref:Uncharacterized protein n=1 Tax=Mycobacterium kansasii 662 TaxID=1299326 RepID=X7ZG59_MYCKA|nr:hypothetical protein I545_3499 [Mycobacterium kansasii 662]KEP39281.1 hypothetical protein MKSMC1_55770 [Mycobacterium kansasii]
MGSDEVANGMAASTSAVRCAVRARPSRVPDDEPGSGLMH